MKSRRPLLVLSLASFVLFGRLGAAHADVRVSYLVEEKPLKTGEAGDVWTFSLYSDDECTQPIGTPVLVSNIGASTRIERLKTFTPRGAAKQPTTARVTANLVGRSAPGTFWLDVSGTGITPAGGSCQLQGGNGIAPSAGHSVGGAAVLQNCDGVVATSHTVTVTGDSTVHVSGLVTLDYFSSGNGAMHVDLRANLKDSASATVGYLGYQSIIQTTGIPQVISISGVISDLDDATPVTVAPGTYTLELLATPSGGCGAIHDIESSELSSVVLPH